MRALAADVLTYAGHGFAWAAVRCYRTALQLRTQVKEGSAWAAR